MTGQYEHISQLRGWYLEDCAVDPPDDADKLMLALIDVAAAAEARMKPYHIPNSGLAPNEESAALIAALGRLRIAMPQEAK